MDQHMFDSAGGATSGIEGASGRDAERGREFATSEEQAARAGSSFGRAAIDMFLDERRDADTGAHAAGGAAGAVADAGATEERADGPLAQDFYASATSREASAGTDAGEGYASRGSEWDARGMHGDRLADAAPERAWNPLEERYRDAGRGEEAEGAVPGGEMFAGEAERSGATLSAWSSAEEIARAVGAEYTGGAQAVDASAIEGGLSSEFDAADAGVFRESDIDGDAVARGYQSRSRMLRESGVGDAGVAGEFDAVEDSPAAGRAADGDISSEFDGSAAKVAERAGMFDAASSRTPFARKVSTLGRDVLEAEAHGLASSGAADGAGAAGSAIGNAAVSAAAGKDAKGIAGAAVSAVLDDSDEEVATAADMVRKGRATAKTAKMAGRKLAEFRARGKARSAGASAARAQRKSMDIARGVREGRAVAGMGLSARIKAAAGAAGAGIKAGVTGAVRAIAGSAAAGPGAFAIILIALLLLFGGGQQSQGVGILTGVEADVAQFFKDKGLEDVQVAAIMGNMYAESGMNPAAQEVGGGGYGLCQWTGGRRTKLESYAASVGKPASDLTVQLEFFWSHDIFHGDWSGRYYITKKKFDGDPEPGTLVSGSKARFLSTKDVEQAVKEFCYGWERPGIPHITKRVDKAREYLDALGTKLSGQDLADANERQQAVARAAVGGTYGTSLGQCQAFVCRAYKAAGESNASRCCAHAAGDAWVVSTSKTDIPVGATVYVSRSASGTSCSCGRDAGHVGIYIGGGQVASRRDGGAPYIETLEHFADNWGKGGWMGWGWNGGVPLA